MNILYQNTRIMNNGNGWHFGWIYIAVFGFWFFKAIFIDFLVCHHIKRLIIIYVLVQLCGKKGRGSFLGRVGRAIDW